MNSIRHWAVAVLMALATSGAVAEEHGQKASDPDAKTPWGSSAVVEREYSPSKVVYDVSVRYPAQLTSVLDRASFLNNLYNADPFDSSIVLVLHGDEIHFFAIKNYEKYKDLMIRAQSLTVGTTIKIRMCKVAAQSRGYEPKDIHGFVEMVPMADAEIIRLQNEEGHAYMQ